MIHEDTIGEIRRRLDIVDVIGDFVSLKRAGQNYKARSPFTNEKTPSFFVVPSKEIFKDFSSGKGGDVFTFLMEHEGMNYVEAVRYLAGKYGIQVKESNAGDGNIDQQNDRNSLYALMQFAKAYYSSKLLEGEEGRQIGLSYFRERGFNDASIKAFELGYAPAGWDHFLKAALRQGYSEERLEKAGLIITKEDHKPYDRFRKRILFPIHSISGKTIAFGARTLGNEKNQPKYINSPETDVYHKSSALYGLFKAKNAIRKNDNCYLVEGYTDVVSLHQSGIDNTVSSSGTALTKEQIGLVDRFTKNITILFDGDGAGVKAALRGIDLILEEGLNVRIVLFPDGHDPDAYLSRVGASQFQQFLKEESKDFISFKTDLYLTEATDPIRKAEAIGEIINTISLIPDAIKQLVYIQKMAALLNMDEALLVAELNKKIQQHKLAPKVQKNEVIRPSAVTPNDQSSDPIHLHTMQQYQERETIRLLLNYADKKLKDQQLYRFMWNELEDVTFINPLYKEIYEIFRRGWEKEETVDSHYVLQQGDEEVKKVVAELLICRYNASTYWQEKHNIYFPDEDNVLDEAAYTNVLRLKLRIVQNMAQENRLKIKEAEQQKRSEKIDTLLTDQINLDEVKKKLSTYLGIVISQ